MSAFNCIGKKAIAGVVNKAKSEAAQKRIKEIEAALKAQGEPNALLKAEAAYADEVKHAATNQKWRLINRVRVMRDLQAAVDATPVTKLGSMPIKMLDDADFEARAIHKQIMGRVGAFLEKHRVDLFSGVTNPASFKEFLKALHGEPTKDAAAKGLSAAVNDVNEYIRKKLNSYGYSIGKLESWGIPHSHNQMTIGGTPFAIWAQDIDGMLDWAKMTNPKTGLEFGAVPNAAFRQEFLQYAYDNIVYGRNSKAPSWGKTAEGNAIERHRVFAFKNSDAWIEYNGKYGSADPHSTLLQHWDQMSRHIALAKRFGHNAETAIDYLGQIIAKKAKDEGAGVILGEKGQGGVAYAKGMLRVIEGGIGPTGYGGAQRARFFSTARKVLTSAMLDRAVVISIPSDLNSATLAGMAIGMNPTGWFPTYMGLMADAVKGGGMTRQDLLRAQHIAESWANPGVTTSRFQSEYPSAAWADKLSNATMKIQGMNAHTDSVKLAFSWGMAGHMASEAGKPLDQIHPFLRRAMERAGIEAADWDVFRAGPKFTASNGAEFLSPLYWQVATDIDPIDADRLFLKFQTFVEKWQELAVPSRSLIGQGLMDPKAWNVAPGSFPFEMMKSVGMFKSFVAAFVVNQARMFDHMPTKTSKAIYGAALIGTTTLVGATAMQIGDLLMGRDPQDMTTASFWTKAMLRGGGLGPVGDILATGATQWGGGLPAYAAGPLLTTAWDVLKLTLGNAAQAANQAMNGDDIDLNLMQDIIDFQRRYTPMWQTPGALGGAALDRLISDQLLLALDPEAIDDLTKKAKKRENLTGAGTWWGPGSPLPTRAPDLSTAVQ